VNRKVAQKTRLLSNQRWEQRVLKEGGGGGWGVNGGGPGPVGGGRKKKKEGGCNNQKKGGIGVGGVWGNDNRLYGS